MINANNIKTETTFRGVLQGYKVQKQTVKAPYRKEGQFEKGDDVVQYTGWISVLTNPTTGQFATVNVRALQNTYNGELDYTSQALEALSVEGEVETYAKTKDLAKTPTVTIKNASFGDNFYPNKQGEIVESVTLDLGFGRLYLNDPVEEPAFENSVIVYGMVKDVRPEVDKEGEETGRALVDVYVPYTYGSKDNQVVRAYKTTFVAGFLEGATEEEDYDLGADLLDYADDIIEDSWKFGIEINNYYVEKEAPKVETEGGKRFGRQVRETVQTNRERKSEFLLTGIDQLMTPFDEEDIRDALKMREVAIEEAKKRAEERQGNTTTSTAKPSRGITRGRTESTGESTAPTRAGGRTRERRFG